MPAYVVVLVNVTDPDRFGEYLKEVPEAIARYGGRYISRGGEMFVLEGDIQPGRVVLIEFPSIGKAREWYASPEYRNIRTLRAGAATGTLIAVEGC